MLMLALFLFINLLASIPDALAQNKSGTGLPPGGSIGDCILNTASGVGEWGACPGDGYASAPVTLTNKAYDTEGIGNVLTISRRVWFPVAGCNNATAATIWDLPPTNAASAACVTGTNTQKGVLDFADGANLSAQMTYLLPTTLTGTVDARLKWFSATTSGDVVWQLATICVADAETDDPTFNAASTVTDTTKGVANQTNDALITGLTITGCAAGELLHLKVQRDSGHASDSMAGTARLIGVEITVRESL